MLRAKLDYLTNKETNKQKPNKQTNLHYDKTSYCMVFVMIQKSVQSVTISI